MTGKKVTLHKDNRTIRQKPWLVRWYGEFEPNMDCQKRYSRSFRTKSQAERFQEQKQRELSEGDPRDAKEISIEDLCDKYLETKRHALRYATLQNYQYTIDQLLQFFSPSTKINNITRQQAEQFINTRELVHPDHKKNGKKLSSWGRNGHRKNAHAIFNSAVEWEYIKKNPFDKIKAVKTENAEWHFITAAEFQSLLSKVKTQRVKCLYAVMYGCGLRYGEALNLLWNGRDIDFDKNKINIKSRKATPEIPPFLVKDHESRSLPMPEWLSSMLIELQASSSTGCPFVFLTTKRWDIVKKKWQKMKKEGKGGQWQNRDMCNNVLRNFKEHCRAAGLTTDEKLTLHCLRKSYAQNLADHGTPISTLKKLMGHSSIRTTEEYYLRSTDANEMQAKKVLDSLIDESINA